MNRLLVLVLLFSLQAFCWSQTVKEGNRDSLGRYSLIKIRNSKSSLFEKKYIGITLGATFASNADPSAVDITSEKYSNQNILINSGNVTASSSSSTSLISIGTYLAGITSNFKINDHFSVTPELRYNRQTLKSYYDYSMTIDNVPYFAAYDVYYHYHFLETPLSLRISNPGGKLKPFAQLGITPALGLFYRERFNVLSENTDKKFLTEVSDTGLPTRDSSYRNKEFGRFHLGLAGAIGFEYKLNATLGFSLEIKYNTSLTKGIIFQKNNDYLNSKLRTILLSGSLIYYFQKEKTPAFIGGRRLKKKLREYEKLIYPSIKLNHVGISGAYALNGTTIHTSQGEPMLQPTQGHFKYIGVSYFRNIKPKILSETAVYFGNRSVNTNYLFTGYGQYYEMTFAGLTSKLFYIKKIFRTVALATGGGITVGYNFVTAYNYEYSDSTFMSLGGNGYVTQGLVLKNNFDKFCAGILGEAGILIRYRTHNYFKISGFIAREFLFNQLRDYQFITHNNVTSEGKQRMKPLSLGVSFSFAFINLKK